MPLEVVDFAFNIQPSGLNPAHPNPRFEALYDADVAVHLLGPWPQIHRGPLTADEAVRVEERVFENPVPTDPVKGMLIMKHARGVLAQCVLIDSERVRAGDDYARDQVNAVTDPQVTERIATGVMGLVHPIIPAWQFERWDSIYASLDDYEYPVAPLLTHDFTGTH